MKKALVIGFIGIVLVLIISGYFYFKKPSQPIQLEGEESLEIMILDLNNNSVKNLEVDLWTSEHPNGPPSAGILITDDKGIVLFKIPAGEYLIGFNLINFPDRFIYPEKIPVIVEENVLNKKTIFLEENNSEP